MKLVVERRAVSRAVLMFQREVADRLTGFARATGAYGPLTVLDRAGVPDRAAVRSARRARSARVRRCVSTVTRWTRREDDALPPDSRRSAHGGAARARSRTGARRFRRTCARALPGGEIAAVRVLARAGVDGALRAEAIAPDGFVAARAWPSERGRYGYDGARVARPPTRNRPAGRPRRIRHEPDGLPLRRGLSRRRRRDDVSRGRALWGWTSSSPTWNSSTTAARSTPSFSRTGHEDHIGALPFLLARRDVPVYGSPYTLGLVRGRLAQHDARRRATPSGASSETARRSRSDRSR